MSLLHTELIRESGERLVKSLLILFINFYLLTLSEVTISFNPLTYMVQEGQDVGFMIQLIGLAEIVVQVNFQTADGTATSNQYY